MGSLTVQDGGVYPAPLTSSTTKRYHLYSILPYTGSVLSTKSYGPRSNLIWVILLHLTALTATHWETTREALPSSPRKVCSTTGFGRSRGCRPHKLCRPSHPRR